MKAKLDVVVGGQFGSEAKGNVAAQLAKRREAEGYTVHTVRVAGPNAGHSAIGKLDGLKWALRSVPVTAVVNDGPLYIAPGSEVEEAVLTDECDRLDAAGYNVTKRLLVDGQATVLEEHHKEQEASGHYTERFGSTGKGIGAARAARLERNAATWSPLGQRGNDTAALLRGALTSEDTCVIVEGTQGFGLGLHAGYYPFCTSSDCRAVDFLAMAGLSPWQLGVELNVWVVARTYPIRVAGNSGPLQTELTWDEMEALTGGYVTTPELTTVTQKPRRIGAWDTQLVKEALWANGAPSENVNLVVTFLDYIDPTLADTEQLSTKAGLWLRLVEDQLGKQVDAYTTGPDTIAWRSK